VVVPDLTGMTRDDAIAELVAAGLVKGTITEEPSTVYDAGQVIRQTPAADVKVAKGTAVDFVVSTGAPSASPSPSGTLVEVPEVVTMDAGIAQAALEDAGFIPNVKEKASPEPPGTVIQQSPEPGTMAPQGSVVTIWVAK
jgi:serine/threonine-protein kinase